MTKLEVMGHEHSFIGMSQISHEVCDGLLEYYNDHLEMPHYVGSGVTAGGLDKTKKDSHDIHVRRSQAKIDPRISAYLKSLKQVSDLYVERYPFVKDVAWCLAEDFNIQWYRPGGGYHVQHCEQGPASFDTLGRVMVWMTYLNDVEEGGETVWPDLDVKIKPKKGSTLIWPAYWTHSHHGIVAPNEDKYIITGWYGAPAEYIMKSIRDYRNRA